MTLLLLFVSFVVSFTSSVLVGASVDGDGVGSRVGDNVGVRVGDEEEDVGSASSTSSSSSMSSSSSLLELPNFYYSYCPALDLMPVTVY